MPNIKQFINPRADYTPSASGISAFETLGRRVAGQYDQAAQDVTQTGKVQGQITQMLGRWPFNIIALEQKYAQQAAPATAAARPGAFGGVRAVGGGGGGITAEQFAPRVMPNLAALNEMSVGAAQFGHMAAGMVGGSLADLSLQRTQNEMTARYGRGFGNIAGGDLADLANIRYRADAYQEEIDRKAQLRRDQLNYLQSQKNMDAYQKDLNAYNKKLEKDTTKWAAGLGGSPRAEYDESATTYNPATGEYEYGGGRDPKDTSPIPGDYGGGTGFANSNWNPLNWLPTFNAPSAPEVTSDEGDYGVNYTGTNFTTGYE